MIQCTNPLGDRVLFFSACEAEADRQYRVSRCGWDCSNVYSIQYRALSDAYAYEMDRLTTIKEIMDIVEVHIRHGGKIVDLCIWCYDVYHKGEE